MKSIFIFNFVFVKILGYPCNHQLIKKNTEKLLLKKTKTKYVHSYYKFVLYITKVRDNHT